MVVKNPNKENIRTYRFFDFDGEEFHQGRSIKDYKIREFDASKKMESEEYQNIIRSERILAKESGFKISSIVKTYRGMSIQEEEERNRKIRDEVDYQVGLLKEETFKIGYKDGLEIAKNEIYEKMKESSDDKLEKLTEIIKSIVDEKKRLLQKEKKEIYQLIKSLTKWIILRELKDDGDYVKRLLEKLIEELGSEQKILVQIGKSQFDKMSEIKSFIHEKMKDLKNVRLELDYDIPDKGIVIEAENTLIRGTLEEQFLSLDKLFETVGLGNNVRREES